MRGAKPPGSPQGKEIASSEQCAATSLHRPESIGLTKLSAMSESHFPIKFIESQRWIDKIVRMPKAPHLIIKVANKISLETRRTTLPPKKQNLSRVNFHFSWPSWDQSQRLQIWAFQVNAQRNSCSHSFIHLFNCLSGWAWWPVRGIIFLWYYL